MLRKTTFFIFFLLIVITAKGQQAKTSPLIGDGFYIAASQLVYPEIVITYEQFIRDEISISYSLGFKIPNGTDSSITSFGTGLFAVYENQYMFNEYSNAIFTSLAPTYYFGNKRIFYIQSELFYRHYWLNKQKLQYNEPFDQDYYNSIRSEKINVIGLRLLAGFNSKVKLSNKLFLSIKTYCGLSFKYKNYWYENVDNKTFDIDGNNISIPYEEENGDAFSPYFHVGIKIGIAKITSK